jgi:hypothetical protein
MSGSEPFHSENFLKEKGKDEVVMDPIHNYLGILIE